jgi:hypothetical protein
MEDYGFNLEAKPFTPKSNSYIEGSVNNMPLDLTKFKSTSSANAPTEPIDPEQEKLEQKR